MFLLYSLGRNFPLVPALIWITITCPSADNICILINLCITWKYSAPYLIRIWAIDSNAEFKITYQNLVFDFAHDETNSKVIKHHVLIFGEIDKAKEIPYLTDSKRWFLKHYLCPCTVSSLQIVLKENQIQFWWIWSDFPQILSMSLKSKKTQKT